MGQIRLRGIQFLPRIALLIVLIAAANASGQGITVTGVGAVNRSMGGAGTAAPLEAIGAIHWNPGIYSPPRPWTHTADWKPPANVNYVSGPVKILTEVCLFTLFVFIVKKDCFMWKSTVKISIQY